MTSHKSFDLGLVKSRKIKMNNTEMSFDPLAVYLSP